MTTNRRARPAADESASIGVRELLATERAATNSADAARKRVETALMDTKEMRKLRIVEENSGFDPYNSGSFDRRNAWSKVSKR